MDIRNIALQMFISIDRTSPSNYPTFQDYTTDYLMRWKAAMELLQYADEVDEAEEYDSDYDSEAEYESNSEADYETDPESDSEAESEESVNARC